MAQTVLPFDLDETNDELTSHAGLGVFGEFLIASGVDKLVNAELPGPGSAKGYQPWRMVLPVMLTLTGGGRTLEDTRIIRQDTGLCGLLGMTGLIPSSDAIGDWLRRMGDSAGTGLPCLAKVHKQLIARMLRREARTDYTLDIDATQIIAEKYAAKVTYKGEKGYMPMVGHLAENGLVILEEFREGNVAPADENLEFIQACEAVLPKGKHIVAVRADSAAYQAVIFNYLEENGKQFAIGAVLDASVKKAINGIFESEWKRWRDAEIAVTKHCMAGTNKSFRLIVVRRPQQPDLLDPTKEPYRYTTIASNRMNEDAATTLEWYARRGDASENRHKDLKIGFGMERMPCGQFGANAVFFRIGVITYNLFVAFKTLLDPSCTNYQVQTVRWRLLNTAGKIVRHAGKIVLKVAHQLRRTLERIRQRCFELFLETSTI